MMPKAACLAAALAAGLAASAHAGQIPAKFVGAWGRENCTVLVVRFGPETFASPADGPAMPVLGAVEADGTLNVTYTNPDVPKPVTDTYAVVGDKLKMLRTSVGGDVLAEFDSAPWDHCP